MVQVESSWRSLLQWWGDNAPGTFSAVREAAPLEQLHAAQRRTGGWNWPGSLIALYSLTDGTARTTAGYALPGFRILSLDEVVTWWENLFADTLVNHRGVDAADVPQEFEARDEFFADWSGESTGGEVNENGLPAGTGSLPFLSPWLPVAEDQSGTFLVVDRRRANPRTMGLVMEFEPVDGAEGERGWSTVGALLASTLKALEKDESEKRTGLAPVVVGGEVHWE